MPLASRDAMEKALGKNMQARQLQQLDAGVA
jgi:hypothetical protein